MSSQTSKYGQKQEFQKKEERIHIKTLENKIEALEKDVVKLNSELQKYKSMLNTSSFENSSKNDKVPEFIKDEDFAFNECSDLAGK